MDKTPEQQVDEIIEILKSVFVSKESDLQEQTNIKNSLDALGYEVKAMSAIINDNDVQKAMMHLLLSRLVSSNNNS